MIDFNPLIADWPGAHGFAIADGARILGAGGHIDATYPIASVTKLFTAYAVLVAVEEGTVALDDAAGPTGSTLRHLLAHASGLAFDEDRTLARVGHRRIYSNVGIEAAAAHLESRAGMAFDAYVRVGVLEPLGLGDAVQIAGSPAHGWRASVTALIRFAQELLAPTLIHASTMADATAPVWPELRGVLPGFGRQDPNPWGLGFEVKGTKEPHWTAPGHGPDTFGHFGGAGSFLWVDRDRGLVGASAGTVRFAEWAARAWPVANQAALDSIARVR